MSIMFVKGGSTTDTFRQKVFIFPQITTDFSLEGEVVFAGYGIQAPEYAYDDYAGIDAKDKLVLIMSGEPMNMDGTASAFTGSAPSAYSSENSKMRTAATLGARGILIVLSPRSGFASLEEMMPGAVEYFTTSYRYDEDTTTYKLRMCNIHREVADVLLSGSGYVLDSIQATIDRDLCPISFPLTGKNVLVSVMMKESELPVENVLGYLEGSDPGLKNEVVVMTAHFDHLGVDQQGRIYHGADDNASGSAALLEIAEAYAKMKKKPARSVIFLWLSGEEEGLFGSEYYVQHPAFPLDSTVIEINMDMIGRVKKEADTCERCNVEAGDTVQVVEALQAPELRRIAAKYATSVGLIPDFAYGDPVHPSRKLFGSDQLSFLKKDRLILSFSTGIHSDYHRITDTWDKLDYSKMEKIARMVFLISCDLANREERIPNLHPYSNWSRELKR